MPLISLSQEVIDRGKLPEVGWSLARLNDVVEFKAAQGNSTNYLFEFVIEHGPEKSDKNSGRYCSTLFNSKALGMGEGSKGVPDVINKFVLMVSGLLGINKSELEADDYDTDKLKGKSCWIKIEAITDQNGKLGMGISDYTSSQSGNVPF